MGGKPPDDDEDDETRLLDIDDMVELENNVGESSRRPDKRKRNGRNRASKDYCQKLSVWTIYLLYIVYRF